MKISVIIPIYNRERFLADAIESVINQTFSDWELVLVDDGSIDQSLEIAREFADRFPDKINLITHPECQNHGASASRNLGVLHAKGDLLTFLDSDDVLLPEALENQVEAFRNYSDADAVCGTLQYWFSWSDQFGQKERDFVVDLGIETEKLYDPPELFVKNLRSSGRKPGMGCVTVKRAFANGTRLFKDDFRYTCEDQIFWSKVGLSATVYVLNRCLIKYRQHEDSKTAKVPINRTSSSGWEQFLRWLESYLKKQNVEDPIVWKTFYACRRNFAWRRRFNWILNYYRSLLPLHVRYKFRDAITKYTGN